jgi:hypothetical protein
VAYRAVIIGFPVFAVMLILGSYWASIAWGRYWGWDPKETSALVTWLIYAAYLHARSQRGWAGRPAALILVLGFGAVLFTYFGNLFFAGSTRTSPVGDRLIQLDRAPARRGHGGRARSTGGRSPGGHGRGGRGAAVPVRGHPRAFLPAAARVGTWLPLHLALAGGASTAIAG